MKGNWGKILKVNLTKGYFEDVDIPEKDYRDYLGGSGLAAKYFFDTGGWKADPLSPKNPFMVMLGPISGTNIPGSSRLEICARSPLTGIWGESCMGGHFAPQLKGTGYDGIVVTGSSKKPVYLYITEDEKEIRDAKHLWGKDTYETEDLLKEELGDNRAQVISIGPAGENLVKYACVMNNKGSTAGRCGMGAVMGSKNLKAVVCRGKKKAPIADETAYKKLRNDMLQNIKTNLVAKSLHAFGSNVHMEYGMAISDVPVKNWRVAYWKEGPEKLGGTAVANSILTKTHSCYACPISCKRIVKVDNGPFRMKEGPGSEYEAAAALGTLHMIDSAEANNKLNELCNKLGMDCISAGATLSYAIEAYEKGILTDEETEGISLGWNKPETMMNLVEKTAVREGFGDILAEGSRAISEKFGGKEMAIHVKGLECPMHDPRALWGMALSYATSIRGACHCADTNLYVDMGILNHKDLGVGRSWPYKAKGKAKQTVASQVKGIIANSAIMCEYVKNVAGHIDVMVPLLNATTGLNYSKDDLVETAHRIWYLKRAIGNLCGATREDDKLPKRLTEPHPEGLTSNLTAALYPQYMVLTPILDMIKSEKIMNIVGDLANKALFTNFDKIMRSMRFMPIFWIKDQALKARLNNEIKKRTIPVDSMLDEFYKLRDIDFQGRPSRARLESMGMKDVAEALFSSK